MNDSRESAYLQHVLALDPQSESEAILQRRRDFLQPADVVVAELAHDDLGGGELPGGDLRTQMLHRLNGVRREFWSLPPELLERELSSLLSVAHPETTAAARRLRQVAGQRETIDRLLKEPSVHPAFVRSLAAVLVAPPAEANRLREREHRWMRPEQNPQFDTSRRAIQGTANFVRVNYPQVFLLEEAWLTELLEYNPVEETEDESGNTLFGFLMLAGLGATLFIIVAIIGLIFK